MTLSDECEVYYCKCGNFAYKNFKTNIYYCSKCIHITEIRKMKIPYAFKLMIQELMSMGIMCKMVLGDDKESKLK